MDEIRIDLRKATPEERAQGMKEAQNCFKLNHTMPYTDEYNALVKELFGEFGETSRLMPPTTVVRGQNVKIGQRVVVMNNSLFDDEVVVVNQNKWRARAFFGFRL